MRGLKTRSSSERELKGRGARTKIPKRTFTDAESSSESSSESASKSTSKSTSESEEDQNTRRKSRKRKSPKRKSKKKSSKRKLSKRKAKLSSSDDHESSSEEEPVTKPSKAEASKAAAKAEVDKHLKRVKDVPPPPAPESIKETNTSEAEIAFLEVDTNGPVDLGTPSKTGSSHSPRINSVKKQLFDTKRSPLKPFESANKHLSHGKLTKIRCKQGKKVKHSCGFRLKCEPEEAILHILCSISGKCLHSFYFFLCVRRKSEDFSIGERSISQVTKTILFNNCFFNPLVFFKSNDLCQVSAKTLTFPFSQSSSESSTKNWDPSALHLNCAMKVIFVIVFNLLLKYRRIKVIVFVSFSSHRGNNLPLEKVTTWQRQSRSCQNNRSVHSRRD